jgi:hypothetical protein
MPDPEFLNDKKKRRHAGKNAGRRELELKDSRLEFT